MIAELLQETEKEYLLDILYADNIKVHVNFIPACVPIIKDDDTIVCGCFIYFDNSIALASANFFFRNHEVSVFKFGKAAKMLFDYIPVICNSQQRDILIANVPMDYVRFSDHSEYAVNHPTQQLWRRTS